MKFGKWRKLKIKVGGNTIKTMKGAQDEDVQFLEKLDREFGLINDVFRCLTKIQKSIDSGYPFDPLNVVVTPNVILSAILSQKETSIHLDCSPICLSREFCNRIIPSMQAELTKKMGLKTRIDRGGFVDFG
ncbi:MAG: hypothetical protein HY665_06375 [Chloroflexi bacterium]|nr:hypothetical protein [Chloroflexota bacterium]